VNCSLILGHPGYKILGPLSVLIAAAAFALLLILWPKGKSASISQHGGAHKVTYWLFASVLILDGGLFFAFMWQWFVPALQLPAAYGYLVALGYLLQIATAVIPDKGDRSRVSRVHAWVAFSMAGVMSVLIAWLTLAPHVAVGPRIFAGLVFLWMCICWLLFTYVKGTRKHFLVYQIIYVTCFYATFLAAAYVH
jgi:hypothetical protein